MPQAKRGTSGSSSSRSGTTKKAAAKSASSSSRAGGRASGTRSAGGQTKSPPSGSTSQASSAGAADPRVEAVAERVRKLNERIIEAGKGAGEVTLTSYEKALKSIASTLERGPGTSDVEWISNLATAQAKFIRDVTLAWTSAARDMIK
jgi:hypothetical protein